MVFSLLVSPLKVGFFVVSEVRFDLSFDENTKMFR